MGRLKRPRLRPLAPWQVRPLCARCGTRCQGRVKHENLHFATHFFCNMACKLLWIYTQQGFRLKQIQTAQAAMTHDRN